MGTYAISDLHGHLDLYKKVKNRMKPQDTLYVLGDCNDRGPQPWETLKTVLEDPQAVLILGNHELMLRDCMRTYLSLEEKGCEQRIFLTEQYDLLWFNGGEHTFMDWLDEEDYKQYYDQLTHLPLERTYYNNNRITIILTHAGYTFGKKPIDIDSFVWNREHFFDKWEGDENTIMVHGHTINENMVEKLVSSNDCEYYMEDFDDLAPDLKKIIYCDGHKYNIDAGTIVTKKVIMLDLDTLEWEIVE